MRRCLLEKVLRRLNDQRFKAGDQEAWSLRRNYDAQEFLACLLSKIDSELASCASSESEKRSKLVSSLFPAFGFVLTRKIVCISCANEVENIAEDMFLSVHIKHDESDDPLSIQTLLDKGMINQIVEHRCPQCNENSAIQYHYYSRLPK
ncbi:unnamed protein product [Gongylonema pulchrum]|uniref:USP domain-containing protein n=1 Tax=Gongylonema pulchrum TaxID=637853 RepID=A0A183EH03_9BILA|nr:unnamed protein product [Gongylonema pulchrum]